LSIINLEPSICVRLVSTFASCTSCVDICPTQAVSIVNNLPAFNLEACVGCSGCVGVCPNEALQTDNYSPVDLFFNMLDDESGIISCQKNIPCLSGLNVEYLYSMALIKEQVVFDIGHCSTCELAPKLLSQIEKNVEEVNFLLEAIQSNKRVETKTLSIKNKEDDNRRGFLSKLNLENIAKAKNSFDDAVEYSDGNIKSFEIDKVHIQKMKNKSLPNKRKLLFSALKRIGKPDKLHVIEGEDISFTSKKIMDEDKCTNCQMCYRICPTGALSSNHKSSFIDFDPFLCIKCHICHDTCEPNAITLSPTYNLKEFFEPEVVRLASFNIKKCQDCGAYFTYTGKSKYCKNCHEEEREALELWGMNGRE